MVSERETGGREHPQAPGGRKEREDWLRDGEALAHEDPTEGPRDETSADVDSEHATQQGPGEEKGREAA